MARGATGVLIKGLEQLFGAGTLTGLGEAALVERFVARRDAGAFEAIVRQHGPMVWSVCRRSLRDPNDAEDAFQATFLIFAARAGSIRRVEKLGGWLHGVAVKVSSRARRDLSKRPKVVGDVQDHSIGNDAERRDQVAVLHEELARLPGKYRDPIILCHLEGCTHDEAAAKLGWPVGTVRGRLSRGRDQLKERLTRRGMAGAMVGLESVPIPIGLGQRTVTSAISYTTGKTVVGLLSVQGASWLAWGVRTMMIKSWLLSGVVALGVVGAGGAGGLAYAWQEGGGKKGVEKVVEKSGEKAVIKGEGEVKGVEVKKAAGAENAAKPAEEEDPAQVVAELEARIKLLKQQIQSNVNSLVQREQIVKRMESGEDLQALGGIGRRRGPGGIDKGEVDPEEMRQRLEMREKALDQSREGIKRLRQSGKEDRAELARLEKQLEELKKKNPKLASEPTPEAEPSNEEMDNDELEARITSLKQEIASNIRTQIKYESRLRHNETGASSPRMGMGGVGAETQEQINKRAIDELKTEVTGLRKVTKQDRAELASLEAKAMGGKAKQAHSKAQAAAEISEELAQAEADLDVMTIDVEVLKDSWEASRRTIETAERSLVERLSEARQKIREPENDPMVKGAQRRLDEAQEKASHARENYLKHRLELAKAQRRVDQLRRQAAANGVATEAAPDVESRLSRIEQALDRLEKASKAKK